jgi:hypothetical protein
LSNSRTRAESLGGTSSTVSPAATNCWANSAPVPVAPSTARPHPRHEGFRPHQQLLSLLSACRQVQHRAHALVLVERGRGVRAAVRIDPDHKHGLLLISLVCHGGQT